MSRSRIYYFPCQSFARSLDHQQTLSSLFHDLVISEMTRFRPCIDLHSGQVKQIIGGTLSTQASDLKTNYVSTQSASYFADLYRKHDLIGAHVIMLGPGNEAAARDALEAWPGSFQVGGGINEANAKQWIDAGAEKVNSRQQLLNLAYIYEIW